MIIIGAHLTVPRGEHRHERLHDGRRSPARGHPQGGGRRGRPPRRAPPRPPPGSWNATPSAPIVVVGMGSSLSGGPRPPLGPGPDGTHGHPRGRGRVPPLRPRRPRPHRVRRRGQPVRAQRGDRARRGGPPRPRRRPGHRGRERSRQPRRAGGRRGARRGGGRGGRRRHPDLRRDRRGPRAPRGPGRARGPHAGRPRSAPPTRWTSSCTTPRACSARGTSPTAARSSSWGAGPGLGAADYAALTIKETAAIPAESLARRRVPPRAHGAVHHRRGLHRARAGRPHGRRWRPGGPRGRRAREPDLAPRRRRARARAGRPGRAPGAPSSRTCPSRWPSSRAPCRCSRPPTSSRVPPAAAPA